VLLGQKFQDLDTCMLLKIENLTFGWQKIPLLENINCILESGDVVLLKGENGSGKTTLLQLISGMIPHFSRGRILKGNVKINESSIINNPPKQFFPQIAFIPVFNIDFFLLNGNLSEEILLAQGVLHLSASKIEQLADDLKKHFPEIIEIRTKEFTTMTAYEKILSLVCIYYIQGARLYLFDEILNLIPYSQLNKWFKFFTMLNQQGCGIILIAHRLNQHKFKTWEIRNKRLMISC
jgi:ABC-type branched-subunit amino acid transport system ATPase component